VVDGLLGEAVYRGDGKQLLHRPAIGHALEEAEVAEVGIRQHGVEALELFGEVFELAAHGEDAAAYSPVEVLGQAALAKRQVAEAE
jgi:hypothetical protein